MISNEELRIDFLFMKAAKLYRNALTVILRQNGLYPGQEFLLCQLSNSQSRLTDLSETLGVSVATISKMIQRLEKNNFVQKNKDRSDSRSSIITLTSQGNDLIEKIHKIQNQFLDQIFSHFSTEEKIVFRRLLIQMISNLANFDLSKFQNCLE